MKTSSFQQRAAQARKGAPSEQFAVRLKATTGKVAADGSWPFEGYAAVFDQISAPRYSPAIGRYVLSIKRGAFDSALAGDTRFLINHEGMPLARTTNGTLKMRADRKGLKVNATIGAYKSGADLRVALGRGDMDQMSFSCVIEDDRWIEREGQLPLRELVSLSALDDVSVVTEAQWPQTEAAISAALAFALANRRPRRATRRPRDELAEMRLRTARIKAEVARTLAR